MDHIEEMQKKMNMMQEQMRRNMELMVKSKNLKQPSFIHDDEPSILIVEVIPAFALTLASDELC